MATTSEKELAQIARVRWEHRGTVNCLTCGEPQPCRVNTVLKTMDRHRLRLATIRGIASDGE